MAACWPASSASNSSAPEIIVYSRLDAIGETMIAKVSPSEGTGLAAGMPIHLHVAGEHVLVFGADGARQPATPWTTAVAPEAAHG